MRAYHKARLFEKRKEKRERPHYENSQGVKNLCVVNQGQGCATNYACMSHISEDCLYLLSKIIISVSIKRPSPLEETTNDFQWMNE